MTDWIEANGVVLRYDRAGPDPVRLVLVHEMGGTLESWDGVMGPLSARRGVLCYDMRGAGLSEKIRAPVRFDDLAGDLAGLLDALDVAGPVAVMGTAVGGGIAIRFAARWPERVSALIVTSAATGLTDATRRQAMLDRAEAVERGGMRAVAETSLANAYPERLRDGVRWPHLRRRWLANDPSSFARLNRMLVEEDLGPDFARIRCPTLVIAATHDGLRPPAAMREMAAAFPDGRCVEIESGHFMACQTPELMVETVEPFLSEVRI